MAHLLFIDDSPLHSPSRDVTFCEVMIKFIPGWWFQPTPTPLKNDGVRQLGLLFPTEWKKKSCSKPPTSSQFVNLLMGMFPLTHHDYSEVAVRSLQFTQIYIYIIIIIINNNNNIPIIIPYMKWKNKSCSKPPTRLYKYIT